MEAQSLRRESELLMSQVVTFGEFRRHARIGGGLSFTLHINQPIGKLLAFLAYKLGLTPNSVSVGSLVMALFGAVAIIGIHDRLIAGIIAAILWQISYSLDCADGILARFSKKSSLFGAWLDLLIDRINTFVIVTVLFTRIVTGPMNFGLFALVLGPILFFGLAVNLKQAFNNHTVEGPKERSLLVKLATLPSDTGLQYLLLALAYATNILLPFGVLLGVYHLLLLPLFVFKVRKDLTPAA